MKKFSLLLTSLVITFSSFSFSFSFTAPASAVSTAGFRAGNIISDGVFTNKSSMSVSKIQSFLNSKVPVCDTNGQQLSEFGGPDLNGDGKVQRWEWGKSRYNQTKFPCLRNYSEGGKTAARIIYDVSQKYSINPQVMIVLLQKEQGLVTDTWPLTIQYKTATGYGCPDTAPCDTQYYGLTNQLDWAAKMFRSILNNSPTWYTPYILGKNYIQYNPASSCGGSSVVIENRSTQALYNYTPYQPNKAALQAGWGTAPCGAYGNRNFYLFFTSWFGSTHYKVSGGIGTKYTSLGGAAVVGQVLSNEIRLSSGGVYQQFERGRIYWKDGVGAWFVRGGIGTKYIQIGADKSQLGYPKSDEKSLQNGTVYQEYQYGRLYWKTNQPTVYVLSVIGTKFLSLGLDAGSLGYPLSDTIDLPGGSKYQRFTNGRIYWGQSSGAHSITGSMLSRYITLQAESGYLGLPNTDANSVAGGTKQTFQGGQIFILSGGTFEVRGGINARYNELGSQAGLLGLPTSNEIVIDGAVYQQFENGRIYWTSESGAVDISGQTYSTYLSMGERSASLGIPTKVQNDAYQQFSKGRIYSESNYVVLGGIYNKFSLIRFSDGHLGLPTSNEITLPLGVYQQFENGRIYWSSKTGANSVSGGIGRKYIELGASISSGLGIVSSEETVILGGVYQQFENGRIYWSSKTGANSVSGGIGRKYIELGAEKSKLGFPRTPEIRTSTNVYQQFQFGRITWTPKNTIVSYD